MLSDIFFIIALVHPHAIVPCFDDPFDVLVFIASGPCTYCPWPDFDPVPNVLGHLD